MINTPWRLPRQTADLRADHVALHTAVLTASTDEQRAACAVRALQLAERRAAAIEALVAALRPVAESVMAAVAEAWAAIRPAVSTEAPDHRHDPDDARWSAALAARRGRNVGPRSRRGRPSDYALAR